METNYSKAWNDWLASAEGKRCSDIYSLESVAGQEDLARFLKNRLNAAFTAGWNASGVEIQKIISDEFPPPQISEGS